MMARRRAVFAAATLWAAAAVAQVAEDHAVAHHDMAEAHPAELAAHPNDHPASHHHSHAELNLPPLTAKDLEGLTPDQVRALKAKRAHLEWHKKHLGHEKMHAEMLLVLLLVMVLTQLLVVLWKKHYFDSFQAVTLLGMLVVPVYFSVKLHFMRFLTMWSIFSLCTSFVVFKASRHPLDKLTPRRVYTYFMATYKASYIVTFFGYFLAMLDFVGLGVIIQALIHDRKAHPLMTTGMQAMFYGLYFGVLSRDLAEICANIMASTMGYHTPGKMPDKQLPLDVCAICGDKMDRHDEVEKVVKLPCGHELHEFCIRGWSIVGKKQVCPYCNEKVDLSKMFVAPWSLQRQDVLFSQLLDMLRYLVVWLPFIIVAAKGVNHALGLQ
mmetsp:Transcript_28936/g.75890  ORF Transcript_28936/g.75890 Transcript_28936/m.75890 type:complete len:381 (-) Transcript_28936:962-2104(-)